MNNISVTLLVFAITTLPKLESASTELIPAAIKQGAGYTLDSSSVSYRVNTETDNHAHSHSLLRPI